MAAFQIFDPFEVFFDQQGQPLAGGSIKFFAAGTTTPKDVFGNKALTINNGSTVTLDSAGRANVDIWGDGSYYVELWSSGNVKIDDANNVEIAGGSGTALPAYQASKFLTNDGAVLSWADVRQVPDPTGQSGKQLGTDGALVFWETKAVPPTVTQPDIEVTTAKFRAAQGATSFLLQNGAGSAAASGTKATTGSVTFPTPFAEAPRVFVTNTSGYVTQAGDVQPSVSVTARSTTGFTVLFSTQTGESNTNNNITAPVNFDWIALGTVATPAP